MKNFRSKTGPFEERPFFEPEEIEAICEEELKKVLLFLSDPGPIRIERFIEKRFRTTPVYEELPTGVLGFTRFTTKGVESIVVARSLSEEGGKVSERRVNTTLAHEAGHGLLHAHLFAVGTQPQRLFGPEFDPKVPRILCRDESVDHSERASYDGRWWEFQANKAIGALLLPKALVAKALNSMLEPIGSLGMRRIKANTRNTAARLLSETFNVNPAVAKIRLGQLFPESDGAQLTL